MMDASLSPCVLVCHSPDIQSKLKVLGGKNSSHPNLNDHHRPRPLFTHIQHTVLKLNQHLKAKELQENEVYLINMQLNAARAPKI